MRSAEGADLPAKGMNRFMSAVQLIYRTSIGKKVIMAVTGLILAGYVFVHMLGNLKIYLGAESLNHYAEWLREVGAPFFFHTQALWLVRIVLLVAVGLHILTALQLWGMANAARSAPYDERKPSASLYIGQMMRLGGLAIAFFVFYHIMHFTTGTFHPTFVPGEVYYNVVSGFQMPLVSLFYIAALVALGVHMLHGIWSMFQSVGLNNRRYSLIWRWVAALVTAAVLIGNISIPVAVLAGWIS